MNYVRFQSVIFLSIVFLSNLTLLARADEQTVDPGQITFRSQVSNLDFEQIDPYSGTLSLIHKDVSIPGNGGLDLEIYRTYRTDRTSGQSVLGSLWDTHFGRIKKSGSSVSIELLDGTINSAVKQRHNSAFASFYIYLTKDFWKINMENTPTLQLTDGTEIIFGRSYDGWYYATEIRKNNNTISIYYGQGRMVSYVVDANDRRFDFNYKLLTNRNHRAYRLESITCNNDPEQRDLVEYSYDQSTALKDVTLPDGEKWSYQYAYFKMLNNQITKYLIKNINTPYGGTIRYDYDFFKRANSFMGYIYQISVGTKIVSGSGLATGTWTYDYGVKYEHLGREIHLDYTTISDPCGRKTTYHFFGYSGGYDEVNNNPGCYKYGLTRHKFTTDNSGRVEEAVEYTWDKLEAALSPLPYTVVDACTDSKTYVPVLLQQTVYHGGKISPLLQDPDDWTISQPKDIYTTMYRNQDDFGNPGIIKEYDKVPLIESAHPLKTSTINYWYNEYRNIVKDKVESMRIQGFHPFSGNFESAFDYDEHGNLTEENRFGVLTTYLYNSNGNLDSRTDANNRTITYEWENGAISRIDNPEYTVTRSINWDGTTTNEINGRGHTTSYTYTPGRRIKRLTPPAGNPTIYSYRFGPNSYSKETRGSFSSWAYFDGLGRKKSSGDSIGKTTTIAYKPCGLKKYTTSNIGETISFDNLGRITKISHKDGKQITYIHQSDTDVQVKDEAGKTTRLHYDTLGIPGEKYLTRVTDADGHVAKYSYSILGSLLSASFNSSKRTFTYNSKNFLSREYHPESGITAYTHDYIGNINSKDDGQTTKFYSYDGLNRLVSVSAGSQVLGYQYDDADNLIRLTSPYAVGTYQYDPANRITGATTSTLGKNSSLGFTYDGNDNLKSIRYPSAKTATYSYNGLNQVTGIKGFGGAISNVRYYTSGTSLGLLKSFRFGNNQTTTLSYDKRRAMSRTAAGALNLGFQYNDKRGNMTALVNYLKQGKNKTFSYDNLNRLGSFNGPWGKGRFEYQTDGDRTRKVRGGNISYSYSSNRMISATGTSYSYNSDGDMTRAGSLYFDYTPFHHLWRVRKSTGNIATFGYDGNGNRIYKKAGSTTEIFLRGPDGNILAELNGSGQSKYEFIFLNGKMVARFGQSKNTIVSPWLHLLLGNKN